MKKQVELILLLTLLLFCLGFTLYKNISLSREHHLSLQASSFWQGRTDIQERPEMIVDTVYGGNGRFYFWHEPLPSVLMMPLVLIFGKRAPQGILQIAITLLNIFLVNKFLLRNEKTKKLIIRLWFLLIFFFASNIVSLIFSPNSWYVAQNLGLTFILWGLWEWRGKRNYAVIFIIMLLLVLTKKNMGIFLGVYYLVDFLISSRKRNIVLPLIFSLIAGILGSLFLGWYFGLGFPGGGFREFSRNPIDEVYTGIGQLDKARSTGIFNISNIPTNFVKLFLLGPEIVKETDDANANLVFPYLYPKQDGMSFFLISPVFLALFFLPGVRKKVFLPILGVLIVWAGIYLPYYASGAAQFGSRYTAEFVPFLFLILMEVLPFYFSLRVKLLVLGSALLNVLFFVLINAAWYLVR